MVLSSAPSVRQRWMASHALSVSCVHPESQPSPFGPSSTSSTNAKRKSLSAPGVSISRDAVSPQSFEVPADYKKTKD